MYWGVVGTNTKWNREDQNGEGLKARWSIILELHVKNGLQEEQFGRNELPGLSHLLIKVSEVSPKVAAKVKV